MSAVTRELSRGRSGLPRSPHINGAGRVNRTLVGEVQALCTATVLDQQTFGAGTQPRTAVGAYHAPALPVELYQRSWRGDTITPASQHQACRGPRFERRSRTYEARALPNELHQQQTLGGGGENWTPDDLLCRQTPCCLGYATSHLERSTGIAPVLPDWRSGVLLYTNSALLQKVERAARVELASSAWKVEAPAAIPCSPFLKLWQGWQDSNLLKLVLGTSALPIGSSPLWRSQRELNPSLLIDSQASCR